MDYVQGAIIQLSLHTYKLFSLDVIKDGINNSFRGREKYIYIIETLSWHYQVLLVFCENVSFSHERNKSSFLSKEKKHNFTPSLFLSLQYNYWKNKT